MSIFKVKNKNGTISYGYYFRDRVTKQRYRKIVPLAHTKWDAEQAEIKAKQEIFDKRHGLDEKGKDLLSSFLDDVYLHWRSTMTKPNQILGARWISSHSIISATGTCYRTRNPGSWQTSGGPRAHSQPAVIVALGTGMRMGEQLRMKRHQVERSSFVLHTLDKLPRVSTLETTRPPRR